MSNESQVPLVSVVIPAFNDARYIRQAIESVLAQTHPALDVVVVDDGSTDETVAVVREFGPAVRVIEQQNRGAAAARNRALQEIRGEYVAFLDADDFWHPRKIEAQLRHLRGCGKCVAVYCNKIEIRGRSAESFGTGTLADAELDRLSTDARDSGWLYLALLRDSVVHTSTVLVPREALSRIGTFDESLRKGQDLEFWLRLSRLGPIHRLETVLSAYRVHGASISHRLMSTNYHALVLERAARRFGLSDSSGQSLAEGEITTILQRSWFAFAYQHYRQGSLDIASASIARALAMAPRQANARLLAIRIRLKGMVPERVRAVVGRRTGRFK